LRRPHYKAVFISDTHLGTKSCKAQRLHRFLDSFTSDYLFLVGDMIDGWALRRRHYWPKTHTEVLRRILKLSERCKVIYLPGNHDEFVRPFLKESIELANIHMVDSYVYDTSVFVTHGDYFDWTMKIPTPVINLFAHLWDFVPHSERYTSFTDLMYKWFGTERNIVRWVKRQGYEYCLTGHTHSPKIKGPYMNCGDWVSNCSYIVHHTNNTWELRYYGKRNEEDSTETVQDVHETVEGFSQTQQHKDCET
jgi:UDP-2,3-diacylglucosamine pyrophosphatase LpxH